jgi:hypothetical protein
MRHKFFLQSVHCNPSGGHHAGDLTAAKVLQQWWYWPKLFKDAHKMVKNCNVCQRTGTTSKIQEMAMRYNLFVDPFDV